MAPMNQLTAKVQAISLLKQKIRDNQEMESAIAREIEELETRRSALQRKKRNLNTAYEKSKTDYTQAWNRTFAAKVVEILTARELRDIVYCHLISGVPKAHIIRRHQNGPANEPNRYFFHVQLNGRRGRARGLDNGLEHYFMEKYMGEEFAIEIAQVFNRYAVYNVHHVDDAIILLTSGPLMVHPSCRPLDFLRTLSVSVSMEPYFSSNNIQEAKYLQQKVEIKAKKTDYEKQLSWLSDLAATKQVSRMKITLFVEVRTSSIMDKYKAILLPPIQELVEKDCKMVVSWGDRGVYPNEYEEITYDRIKLLSARQLEDKIADAFENAT